MRVVSFRRLPLVAALALTCSLQGAAPEPTGSSREALIRYLNGLAHEQLAVREQAVAALANRDDVARRQADVRATVLRLIGGLPDGRSDLAVKPAGGFRGEGFAVERVMYDSLAGLHVTANVYVPTGVPGPFPAVVLSPGHSPGGKAELYDIGGNLARAGFVALAWDPIGQGERLQHFDADLGASKVGRPTGEHGHDSTQTMLLGEHVSRYFMWDAMRGIDYLASRADVDASRVGAFGCSGGGTVTAYLAALDSRVKAAATACYLTSMNELLATAGPQDGEQSIPGFVAAGLDFADWVLLAAPKPYAIVSTTEDMFPFAGAKRTYEESKRVYEILGAGASLHFITGPGGHGALGPLYGDIIGFFVKALGAQGAPAFTRLSPRSPEDFLVTETGQVSTSGAGTTVQAINLARADALIGWPRSIPPAKVPDLSRRIREATGTRETRESPSPTVRLIESAVRGDLRVERVSVPSPAGELPLVLTLPNSGGAKRLVVMLATDAPAADAPLSREVDRIAKTGAVVAVLPARPSPPGTEEIKSPLLGGHYLLSLRAMLVGRTLVGLRLDDVLRATEWLLARPDVDASNVAVYGTGPMGVVALHAAALDPRIGRVFIENSLVTWRAIVDQPLHRDAAEVVVPGVLRQYDLPDLVASIAPRAVTIVNPVDAVGNPLRRADARRWVQPQAAEGSTRTGFEHVRLVWRGGRDPLPIE